MSLFIDKPKRMREHPAVNRRVVGSNPTRGAKKMTSHWVVSFFLPIAGFRLRRVVGDAIADLRFREVQRRLKCPNNRYSVASLLTNPTRGAKKMGLKSNVGVRIVKFHNTIFWLNVKCWGVKYKISQYNIFEYQNLFISRNIKEYVF